MNFKEKKEEMMKKYENAVNAISIVNDKDVGVAFDMLVSNITQGRTYLYVNAEEFKKDYEELQKIAGIKVEE